MGYSTQDYARLKTYKGGATIDKSIVYNYFLSPLCNRLVEYLPSWLAPNLLTLFGLICNYLAYFIAAFFLADFQSEAPRWAYLTVALLLWLYVLADNMDGKQARRTGSSSPLGELIDHGCDSQTIGIGALALCGTLRTGTLSPLIVILNGFIPFFLAHWEEHFNHVLILGAINSPSEAEMAVIFVYLISGIVGPSFWQTTFNIGSMEVQLNYALLIFTCVGTALTAIQTIFSGVSLALKKQEMGKGVQMLFPFLVFYSSTLLWFFYSPDLYYRHPHLFITSVSLVFSYITINVIIQRMCQTEVRTFYPMLLPLIVVSMNSFISFHLGFQLLEFEIGLYVFWFVTVASFFTFCNRVLNGICSSLGISAWTIPYPNKATRR